MDARGQSLRSGNTKTIGVLLPLYDNPFVWQIFRGITAEAEASGYKVLVTDSARAKSGKQHLIKELAEQRVDGLILFYERKSFPGRIREQLRDTSRPIVEISSTASDTDLVHQNYAEGMKALMRHLFELEHRHVSLLYGVEDESQGLDRLQAFRQSFAEQRLPFDESWVFRCGASINEGYQAALKLLQTSERPTALVTINDLLGIAAIRAAADLGLQIPGDVSVASFDNTPFAEISVPRLTTVAGEPERSGRQAVRLLLKRLTEPQGDCQTISSGWELIVRESTGLRLARVLEENEASSPASGVDMD